VSVGPVTKFSPIFSGTPPCEPVRVGLPNSSQLKCRRRRHDRGSGQLQLQVTQRHDFRLQTTIRNGSIPRESRYEKYLKIASAPIHETDDRIRMLSYSLPTYFTVFIVTTFFSNLECAKQRSWLGPANLYSGSPPSPRHNLGMVWANGKLFLCGGQDAGSKCCNFFCCKPITLFNKILQASQRIYSSSTHPEQHGQT
jgi:hypothetical protein